MNRKSLASLTIAALLLTISVAPLFASGRRPPPAPPAPVTPRAIFQSLYNNSDAAGSKMDLDGFLANYQQDFKLIELGNKVTDLEDLRFRMSTLFDNAQSARSSTYVTSAVIRGNTGTVMVKSSLAMRLTNPDNQQKFVIMDKVVSKDIWSHTDGGWIMQKSQIISEQNTANGHPIADKTDPFAAPKSKAADADDNTDGNN
jgi:hypothetical protein